MTGAAVRVEVGGEHYALAVDTVLEVVVFGEVTPVPGASRSALGVCNLRGQVLPVFDLSRALGLESGGRPTRIVVADDGVRRVGLAVDHVLDVTKLPEASEAVDSPLLGGAVLTDGVLVGIIDVSAVLEGLDAEAGT
jgi:purine-binding chemotaxis protein CheW